MADPGRSIHRELPRLASPKSPGTYSNSIPTRSFLSVSEIDSSSSYRPNRLNWMTSPDSTAQRTRCRIELSYPVEASFPEQAAPGIPRAFDARCSRGTGSALSLTEPCRAQTRQKEGEDDDHPSREYLTTGLLEGH